MVRFDGVAFSVYFDASASGSGIAGSSNLTGGSACSQLVLAFDVATDLSPTTGPTTYLHGQLAQWDSANYNLFDTLSGWPKSAVVNAFSCCADEDDDIVCTTADNCAAVHNPDQENRDSDGRGDICDTCPDDPLNDRDMDGVCGDVDNCEGDPNPPSDCDGDPGTPDEQCDSENGGVGDGVGDACDNCQAHDNPGQFDTDMDGTGNACETDVDGDGTPDESDPDDDDDGIPDDDGDGLPNPCPSSVTVDCDDNCRTVRNPTQIDGDGDGEGDECDLDDGMVAGSEVSQDTTSTRGVDNETVLFRYGWLPEAGAQAYNVYRVRLDDLSPTDYGTCFRNGILTTYTELGEDPASGEGYGYLITVELLVGEGTLGDDSEGNERLNNNPCP